MKLSADWRFIASVQWQNGSSLTLQLVSVETGALILIVLNKAVWQWIGNTLHWTQCLDTESPSYGQEGTCDLNYTMRVCYSSTHMLTNTHTPACDLIDFDFKYMKFIMMLHALEFFHSWQLAILRRNNSKRSRAQFYIIKRLMNIYKGMLTSIHPKFIQV